MHLYYMIYIDSCESYICMPYSKFDILKGQAYSTTVCFTKTQHFLAHRNRKVFKQHLLGQLPDFKIISQNYRAYAPLQKLLKWFPLLNKMAIRNFDVTLGAGPGGMASKGPKSILYKHSHVAYQIEGYEERIQWAKILSQGHVWESLEVKKVGFYVLFFFFLLSPNSS